MTTSPPRRIALGVLLSSMALMTTELVVTRIFSVIVWYHFAFFAISVALFGMGAAALGVHLFAQRLATLGTARLLSRSALGLAVTVVVVDLALLHLTPDWFGQTATTPFTHLTVKLLALFLITAGPFVAGGFAIALAVTRFPAGVHRLYFMDLLGAGAACLLVIPLLAALGGPLALLVAALLAAVAALVFGESRRGSLITFGVVTFLGLSAPFSGLFRVSVAKGFHLDIVPPEFNRWNSFSMVTVLPQVGFRGWGLSPAYKGPVSPQKTLVIDMNAMTTLTRFSGSFDDVRYTSFDLSAFAYRARPGAKQVCVVGAGGGKDVLAALAAGAKRVTAVEINPLIVNDVMRGQYRDFTGGLYLRDDVDVVVEDGRTFVRGSSRRFDIINLSMVDTSAATAAGAYALTENSLYTADAFRDFLSRLDQGGVLSVASVSLPGLAVGARLAAIARSAVRSGGGDPARSIVVLSTPWLGTPDAVMYEVLVAPDGFDDAASARIFDAARALRFTPVVVPGHPPSAGTAEARWIATIVGTRDQAALDHTMQGWPLDVSATTDNHPFFFYQNRLRDIGRALFAVGPSHLFGNGLVILAKVALVAAVLVAVFLFAPLFWRRREVEEGAGAAGWDLAYVACLGLGFMFLELGLILRFSVFLGHPTATLSVVLLVLLVASALGSRVLAGPAPRLGGRLALVMGVLVALALVLAVGGAPLLEAARGLGPTGRSLLVAAQIAPLAFLLGAPLPTGIRAVSARAGSRVPWLWSVNSGTSVLGSVLATLTAMHAGIIATLITGAALYAVALALSFKVVARAAKLA